VSNPVGSATNNVVAFVTVTDTVGTGLAQLSGSNIVRLTGQIDISTLTVSDATTNYAATGTEILPSAFAGGINSLSLDTSTQSGSLDILGSTLTLSSGGLFMSGANNFTISDSGLTLAS
jgi:hypothetical protein